MAALSLVLSVAIRVARMYYFSTPFSCHVIVNALPDNIPHAVCPCNGVGGSGLSAITARERHLVPSREVNHALPDVVDFLKRQLVLSIRNQSSLLPSVRRLLGFREQ